MRPTAPPVKDKVYDFSIGNPSVPAPDCVAEAISDLLATDSAALHGYTPASGLMSFRTAIAEDLNRRYQAGVSADMIYVTCGAAAGCCCAGCAKCRRR